MKQLQHGRRKARTVFSFLLLLSALSAWPTGAALASEPPNLMLNEVMFDQVGDDSASVFGSEWVELHARSSVNLADYALEDQAGNVLGTLPDLAVPQGSYVLIILGGMGAYLLDDDDSSGALSLALGLTPGDHLPNAQNGGEWGGVRLKHGGDVVDQLSWGHGEPPTGVSGAWFDLSFATGRPLNEGDSLGRSATPVADWTGTSADWDRNGGMNAAGPTPKGPNRLMIFDRDSILKWAQTGVCDIVNSFAYVTGQPGKFRFTHGSVSDVVADEQGSVLTVTASHTWELMASGALTTLEGEIVKSVTRTSTPGAVSFTQIASGSLASPQGWGLEFTYERTLSGFHSNQIIAVTDTAITWLEVGVGYPYSCTVTKTLTRTGDHTWELSDERAGTDHGGGGTKSSAASAVYTRLGDGTIRTTFDLLRDMPIGPPLPGASGGIEYQQRLAIETVSSGDDLGSHATRITRYDEYRDGQIEAQLQPDKQGLAELFFNGVSESEPLGSANYTLTLPLEIDGFKRTLTITARGELSITDDYYAVQVEAQLRINGLLANAFTIYADPPLQGGSASTDGGSGGGFGDAAIYCAAVGGAVGSGIGTVAGGAIGLAGGATVTSTVGALGGPPGIVAGMAVGGLKGAAYGAIVGAGAGGTVGVGLGAASCMAAYGAKKAWGWGRSAWNWAFGDD